MCDIKDCFGKFYSRNRRLISKWRENKDVNIYDDELIDIDIGQESDNVVIENRSSNVNNNINDNVSDLQTYGTPQKKENNLHGTPSALEMKADDGTRQEDAENIFPMVLDDEISATEEEIIPTTQDLFLNGENNHFEHDGQL